MLDVTALNKHEWLENIDMAERRNHMIFWGAVVSAILGAALWLTILIVVPLSA